MMDFTLEEAAAACGGKLYRGEASPGDRITRICHDTRELVPGDFFIALKGARRDGHSMLPEAFRKGAAGAIVSREGGGRPPSRAVVCVKDTLAALKDIASSYRRKFDIPVVGITGSTGKTTVREMLFSILSPAFRVLRPVKNYNNHIGLPLTLLRLESSYTACVLEMGMSGPGEISLLRGIAAPDTGVITNIGLAHLENFSCRDGIAAEKAEILPGLKNTVLNAEDDYFEFFRERAHGEVRTFGACRKADFRAEKLSPCPGGWRFLLNGRAEVFLPLRGAHSVPNALSAAAAASFLGAGEDDCAEGLAGFSPPPMRLEEKSAGGVRIIDDSYNASPDSVSAAAGALSELDGRKFFVLGDMLELGSASKRCHEEAGRIIASCNPDFLFTAGDNSEHASRAAGEAGRVFARHFASKKALAEALLERLEPGDTVLIKGSRGSGMDEIVSEVETRLRRGG